MVVLRLLFSALLLPGMRVVTLPRESGPSYDFEIVRDTASLFFVDELLKQPDQPWVVAHVVPGPISYKEGNDEAVSSLPDGTPVRSISGGVAYSGGGAVKDVLALTKAAQEKAGTIDQYFVRNRRLRERLRYDALNDGGTVVARIESLDDKTVAFPDADVIPVEWRDQVLPAIDYFKTHKGLLANPPEKISDPEKALSNENPFCAVAAFRAIAVNDPLNPLLIRACKTSEGMKQAMYVYLLMRDARDSKAQCFDEIKQQINNATTADVMRPIALGVYAVATESVSLGEPYKSARQLLREVKTRAQAVKAIGADKSIADYLLELREKDPPASTTQASH